MDPNLAYFGHELARIGDVMNTQHNGGGEQNNIEVEQILQLTGCASISCFAVYLLCRFIQKKLLRNE